MEKYKKATQNKNRLKWIDEFKIDYFVIIHVAPFTYRPTLAEIHITKQTIVWRRSVSICTERKKKRVLARASLITLVQPKHIPSLE
jgi:hypothetical protein